MHTSQMVQFPALGLEIPEDHPDRNRYFSMGGRRRQINASDVSEIPIMSSGDIVLLYSDGVYDGSDKTDRLELEHIVRDLQLRPAKDICDAMLDCAVKHDEDFRKIGEEDRIDDKTAFVIKYS
jgi:serine/threonine protein phosphatase PrpC